jgi:glutamate/tyrosine decarboxylase-like PLP-dependent enzyme
MSEHKRGALFPPVDERIACEHHLSSELMRAYRIVASGPVTPTLDHAAFKTELSQFDFNLPRPLEEVLDWTNAQLERGIVHVTHPRYFGLFNPAPTFPAQCADRIAATFNPQLASSRTSPVAVEIEAHVIRSFAQRAGLATGVVGHFTSGGSEANFTALLCALTRGHERFATDGARAYEGAPVFYVSRECHLVWIKIAHETGIGRSAVRLIATDGRGRMDSVALRRAIEADRSSGSFPVMVTATAGTTGAGMIDPLVDCSTIAQDYGLWYHVDAAWGGALAVSDRLRGLLHGFERADSITIDAHKWLATTMGCGMFFTQHASILASTFAVSTSFMPSYIPGMDPYVLTAQWSRRFMGLRLFLGLAAAGWDGYAEHIEQSVALAQYAGQALEREGWEIINDSSLAVLCIRPQRERSDIDSIVSHVLSSGRAWISVATFEGEKVIRICVTNGETTRSDVDVLVDALKTALNSCSGPSHLCGA